MGIGQVDKLALKNIFTRMLVHKDERSSPSGQRAQDVAVLIVDDSRTIVRALQLMLEREGYLTFSAVDGVQAVAMTKRQRPDVVLMDVVMPNMNGFEATRALVNDPETAAIPVIMMSGTEQVSDRVWSIRLGARGFLAKPINREELLGKIRSVIAVARRTQEREQIAAIPATDTFRR
jgi:twitching motility two-component system response regulator PilH